MSLVHKTPNSDTIERVRPSILRAVVVWFLISGILGIIVLLTRIQRLPAVPWYVLLLLGTGMLGLGLFKGWRWAWVASLVLSFVMIPLGVWGVFFRHFSWHRLWMLLQWTAVPYVLLRRDVRHFFFGWIRELRERQAPSVRRMERAMTLSAWLFALVGGLAAWQWWINVDPKIKIAEPALPRPNGYDVFVSAAKAVVVPESLKGYLASDSAKPVSAVDLTKEPSKVRRGREKLVSMNVETLRLFRSGLNVPCRLPPVQTMKARHPHLDELIQLARLLRTEGQVLAAQGKWAEAVDVDLQALELGVKLELEADLVGRLVGMKCETSGAADIPTYTPHLSSREARAAARRLSSITGEQHPFSVTLEASKRIFQRTAMSYFTHSRWRRRFAAELSEGNGTEELAVASLLSLVSECRIIQDLTADMDEFIANSRRPFPEVELMSKEQLSIHPRNLFKRTMGPVFHRGLFRTVKTAVRNHLLLLRLALHAFHEDEGRFPPALSALQPGYLTYIPTDPFSPKHQPEPIRYELTKTGCIFYSVGPDGIDDHGKAIGDKVKPDSLGDLVATLSN